MNSVITSKIAALTLGIAGIVLVSVLPASAGSTARVTRDPSTEVRDHRTPPVIRDHRKPTVRDHRTVPCLGNLCN